MSIILAAFLFIPTACHATPICEWRDSIQTWLQNVAKAAPIKGKRYIYSKSHRRCH